MPLVRETIARVTGDAKTQAEGAAEKAAGKVQNIVGGAKDARSENGKPADLSSRSALGERGRTALGDPVVAAT